MLLATKYSGMERLLKKIFLKTFLKPSSQSRLIIIRETFLDWRKYCFHDLGMHKNRVFGECAFCCCLWEETGVSPSLNMCLRRAESPCLVSIVSLFACLSVGGSLRQAEKCQLVTIVLTVNNGDKVVLREFHKKWTPHPPHPKSKTFSTQPAKSLIKSFNL